MNCRALMSRAGLPGWTISTGLKVGAILLRDAPAAAKKYGPAAVPHQIGSVARTRQRAGILVWATSRAIVAYFTMIN